MGIDILEHCKKVRAEHGPPYSCPIEKCGRTYKSVCGLQYHLKSYDHDNPTPQVAPPTTPKSNKKGRGNRGTPSTSKLPEKNLIPEPLTQDEAQKMVQFQLNNNQVFRVNINEVLEVCSLEDFPRNNDVEEVKPTEHIPLPEATYKELDSYNICDAPPRPNAYIRFIEKSAEELDGEVEYDVDEEDTAWLSIMNEKREEQGLPPVSVDSLELLMDRFEKESYFQAAVNGQTGAVVDDDAVCCICMDGECQNTNVILFCDMCNLAVHQDCYGVPYIPEGQWLCRRCLQSPSRAVDCVLCPNQGGAFKQTDRSQWAHVVCALWIPEVRFANTVFLEPIDSIETIPQARWKLTCYVCKQKGIGACIQCHKTNCYSAFHVTCAQQAGLYMKMDTVTKDGCETQPLLVQKIAFCDVHAPPDFSDTKKEDVKLKMKQARKLLAKKRSSVPVILIPTIPPERIQEIGSLVTIQKKSQFIQRLIAYWTLKRQFRNGVPLLRRLQSSQDVANVYPGNVRDSGTWNVDTMELIRQLKYWQCLRQDLERARLLCELVRKREKLKVELMKAKQRCLNVELKPLEASLRKVLDLIAAKDVNEIFLEPVDLEEVPDYTTVVTEPMDLSTMTKKLDDGLYPNLKSIEIDFELMISNCLAYNNKDTVFYKAGIKMRDQCSIIFKQAREELENAGLLDETKSSKSPIIEEITPADIDKEFESLQGKTGQDIISKLENLLGRSHGLKHGTSRIKRVKLIKAELLKARRALIDNNSSQSDDVELELNTNKINKNVGSPQSHGGSPTGINRRNAVLFTKKAAQAAFKKPEEEKDEVISPKMKKKGRPRRVQEPTLIEPNVTISENVPDSFRVYRPGHQPSDDEFDSDTSTSLSTCYSHDLSEIESDEEDDENDSDASSTSNNQAATSKLSELKPLQLVWAKCRGYPWYPALIIDPEMPSGYIHNGVPIPSPPHDVLALKASHNEQVYLVLFFDAKRTWQWLPVEKLEILGLDTERDEAKVNEPRKATDRKAVKKAYEHALQYQTDTQSMDVDAN
ncbi:bromodomain-containing protein homolog [Onthophagus taurus]|uniref:bromodomain-containing protein homolog n=1 Tax=Onthophagus taurus TaxID=166361 RepID=UPI000C20B0A4|nr:peregrin [Onthophagus taurus]XP_022907101.1 peregrin [Onthophagus taurus]